MLSNLLSMMHGLALYIYMQERPRANSTVRAKIKINIYVDKRTSACSYLQVHANLPSLDSRPIKIRFNWP